MQIGYARISTDNQSLDLQCDALRSAGCDKVFEDTMSGAKAERPGLRQALGHLRDGDTGSVAKNISSRIIFLDGSHFDRKCV